MSDFSRLRITAQRVVLLSLCASAVGCGGTPRRCDATSCTTGCCDSTGVCQPDAGHCGCDGGTCPAAQSDAGMPALDAGRRDAGVFVPSMTCGGTLQECDGTCVDMRTNPSHCGACGRECRGGQVCDDGFCDTLPDDCVATGRCAPGYSCDPITRRCDLGCRLNSECPMGARCETSSKRCACPAGAHLCGQRCVPDDGPLSCGQTCTACAWSMLPQANPMLAQMAASLVWDSARSKLVLVGQTGTTMRLGVWELDGDNWVDRQLLDGPTLRVGAAVAYDSVRQRVVLFGGANETAVMADTYEFDGTTWSEMAPTHSPPARTLAAVGYDPERGVVVVHGGHANATSPALVGDTWEWNGTDWFEVPVGVIGPGPRAGASLVWDPVRRELLMFGGEGTRDMFNDVWSWNGTRWFRLQFGAGPAGRGYHFAAYDARRGRHLVIGGSSSTGVFGDVWELAVNGWSSRTDTRLGRLGLGAIGWDGNGKRFIIFGGADGMQVVDTTWAFRP